MIDNRLQDHLGTPDAAPVCIFEPFQDRLSRDTRNGLSRSLARSLAEGSMTPFEAEAAALLARAPARCYSAYIESRLERYRLAFSQIRCAGSDPFRQGLVLWNLGLFFEVHEVLEHAWHQAAGSHKLLLQAMIRAAGVYVKLEYGYARQAAKLAAKARYVLEQNGDALRQYFDPEDLLQALDTLAPEPPVLLLGKTKERPE